MNQLVVQEVRKEFPTRTKPLLVLDSVSFELKSGESMAVVGPSGSGKSTLLAILGGLDTPTSGTVTLDGVNPFALDEAKLADYRNHQIGFIFQDHHLLPQCSVVENILVPTLADGKPTQAEQQRAEQLVERIGLLDRKEHLPSELSGGERQRVAIARALIRQPKLLLADEPTGNLDQTTADSVGKLLLDIQAEQQTLLMVVTHSERLAVTMKRRLKIEQGKLREAESLLP